MQAIYDTLTRPSVDTDIVVTIDPSEPDFSQVQGLSDRLHIRPDGFRFGNDRRCERRNGTQRIFVMSVMQIVISFRRVIFNFINADIPARYARIFDYGLYVSVFTEFVEHPRPHMEVTFRSTVSDPFFMSLLEHFLSDRLYRARLEAFIMGIQLASNELYKIYSRAYRNDKGSRGGLPDYPDDRLSGYIEWADYLMAHPSKGPQRGTLESGSELGQFYRAHPELVAAPILIEDLKTNIDRLNEVD